MLIPYFINFLKRINNMKKYILLLLLAFGSSFCMAQNMPNFNRWYRFPNTLSTFYYSVLAKNNAYYTAGWTLKRTAVGNSTRFMGEIAKIDLNGDPIWHTIIGNDSTEVPFVCSKIIEYQGLIFAGGGYFDIPNNLLTAYVAAFDTLNGQLVWDKKVRTCNTGSNITSISATNDQLLILANCFIENSSCLHLLELDSNKDSINSFYKELFRQNIYAPSSDVVVTTNNELFIAAKSNNRNIAPDWFENTILIAVDTSLNEIRSQTIPLRLALDGVYGTKIQKCKNSNDIFVVAAEVPNPRYPDEFSPYVFKVDSSFNLMWRTRLRGDWRSDLFTANAIIEHDDESLTVFGTNGFAGHNERCGFIAKLTKTGAVLWMRGIHYDNLLYTTQTIANAARTADNGFIICGDVLSDNTGNIQSGWLMKIDSFGCVLPNCHLATEEALETKQPAMLLYPNPATTHINIHIALPEGVEITPAYMDLIDNKGRVLETNKLPMQDMNYEFYLYNYVPGNYFIRIRQGNKQATKQFVKVRG